jgi:hypothetical protein
MILAPPGWGYRPGTNLAPHIDDLPPLSLLPVLKPARRSRVLTETLIQHSAVLSTVTVAELLARYPCLTRTQCYDAINNARRGYLPPPRKRAAA